MARQYSGKYPPQIGDRVGLYQNNKLNEAFIVKDILFSNSILEVENLTLLPSSSTLGKSFPNGAVSFLGPDEVRLITRGESDDADS